MSDIEPPLRQFQAIVYDDPALQSDLLCASGEFYVHYRALMSVPYVACRYHLRGRRNDQ
jgi:hypothetical protein